VHKKIIAAVVGDGNASRLPRSVAEHENAQPPADVEASLQR
jgi:hypothetical protein